MKRTKATINYSRTIQFNQYEPITLNISTTIEDDTNGLTTETIDEEEKSIQTYVDSVISKILSQKTH